MQDKYSDTFPENPPKAPLRIEVQGTITSESIELPQGDEASVSEAKLIMRIGRSEISLPMKVPSAVALLNLMRGGQRAKITLVAEVE